MDYTSRPRTNQGPDASNFEFLKQLYGEVGATQAPLSSSPPQGPTGGSGWNGPSGPPPPPRDKKEEDKEEDDRRLRGVGGVVGQDVIPEAVMEAYKAVLNGESLPQHRSRLLDSDEDGEATLIDMGVGNLGLLVYKLRSVPKGDD